MKKNKIEIKWAIIFTIMILVWMFIEKLAGFHSEHIDKHPIYTNFIIIPTIIIYVLALLDKRKNVYNGIMTYRPHLGFNYCVNCNYFKSINSIHYFNYNYT